MEYKLRCLLSRILSCVASFFSKSDCICANYECYLFLVNNFYLLSELTNKIDPNPDKAQRQLRQDYHGADVLDFTEWIQGNFIGILFRFKVSMEGKLFIFY